MSGLKISAVSVAIQVCSFILGLVIANNFTLKEDANLVLRSFAIYNFVLGIIIGPLSHSILIFIKKYEIKNYKINSAIFSIFDKIINLVLILIICKIIIQYIMKEINISIMNSFSLILALKFQLMAQRRVNILNLNGILATPIILSAIVPIVAIATITLLPESFHSFKFGIGFFLGGLLYFIFIELFKGNNLQFHHKNEIKFKNIENLAYFFKIFNKGILIIIPLMYIPFIFIYIYADNGEFNAMYLSIPISFAGIVSMINSYGKYLLTISSGSRIDLSRELFMTTYRSLASICIVFLMFIYLHQYIYKLRYETQDREIFFIVLLSSLFISQYNILRIKAWEGVNSLEFLFKVSVCIALPPILFLSALYLDLGLIYGAIIYTACFLFLSCLIFIRLKIYRFQQYLIVNILIPLFLAGLFLYFSLKI